MKPAGRWRLVFELVLLGIIIALFLSRGGEPEREKVVIEHPKPPPSPELPPLSLPPTKSQDIEILFPEGSNLNDESLRVLTFYSQSLVSTNGEGKRTCSVILTDTTTGQIVVLSDSEDRPLFFSYIEVGSETATVSSESIAKALIWLNPYVMLLSTDRKKEFLDGVVESTLFPQLVERISALLVTDPKNLLNPEIHPEIVKTAFATVKETFGNFGIKAGGDNPDTTKSRDLRVLDKSENGVSFENPYMVSYGVEWIDMLGKKTYILLPGKKEIATFGLQWPPVVTTPSRESDTITVDDGTYKVIFYKGFNTRIPHWWDPYIPGRTTQFSSEATIVGTSSWHNILMTVDMITGTVAGVEIAGNIMDILIQTAKVADADQLYKLALVFHSKNHLEILPNVIGFMKDYWKQLAYSIWGEEGGSLGTDTVVFLKQSEILMNDITHILASVEWVNRHPPFLWDLAFAPWKVEYWIKQTDGVIERSEEFKPLIPPIASLSISPAKLYVGDIVTFDASGSRDLQSKELKYRFDFDGDGKWDRDWSPESKVIAKYQNSGSYTAKVEVMDEDGLTGSANYYIVVHDQIQGVSAVLVIDKSGSMRGKPLMDAKIGAKTFIGYMGSFDRASIISFDDEVTVIQPFTDSRELLTTAVDDINALAGLTAFFDAINAAITEIKKEGLKRKKVIIVLTDGVENSSYVDYETILELAQKERVPIYTIGLGKVDRITLHQIARETKGLYFYTPTSKQLKSIYHTIAGIQ